jgi:cyclase
MNNSRRHFLYSSVLTTTAISLGFAWRTTPAHAAASLQWQELDTGLALITGAGGAVLVLSGSDGVALVDGGNSASAATLLALVQAKTGQQPTLLFNSHCHREQIGCNETLGKQGATIIAHENTRLWLGTEIISKWENKIYPPLPKPALPTKTFYYDSEALQFNHKLSYGVLPQAHTDGDLYVHLPEQNLLFVGDVVSVGAYPLVDFATNGWIGGMINGLNQILTLCDDNTRVITSSGMTNKAQVAAQLNVCSTLADRLGTHYYKGGSLAEFIASKPTAEFDAQWGNPALFIYTAYEGTLPHVTEIRRFGRKA